MDKNTVTGLVLMCAVIFGYSYLSQPSKEEIAKQQQMQDSIARVEQLKQLKQKTAEKETAKKAQEALQDTTATFYNAETPAPHNVVLKNNRITVTLNTKGGVVNKVVLADYKNQEQQPVTLFDEKDASLNLMLAGKNENIYAAECVFTPVEVTDSTVTMRLQGKGDERLDFRYHLLNDSYVLKMDVQAFDMKGFFAPSTNTMDISWQEDMRSQEKSHTFENRYSSLTYKVVDDGTDYLNENKDDEETLTEKLNWVAFKDQFFSSVMIADQHFDDASLSSKFHKEGKVLKSFDAKMKAFFDPTGAQSTSFQFYYGPNNFHLLKSTDEIISKNDDLELENLVYLGWPLFRWINRWVIIYLFDWLSSWGLSMGVVLFLLTLIIKIAIFPSNKKTYLSSARMRLLKPKVDEISKQYPKKEDAMAKQQAIMALYNQYGVSPMGGCLPMFLQMPIWIALFNFVPNAIELRGESFLWANDLSAYDDLISWGTNIWPIGDHISIFCLLFTLTNIFNTWISMKQQQSNAMTGGDDMQANMKMMQWVMMLMPLMFFFMFNDYSSGLCYYYFISGLMTIIIMWYLRITTDDKRLWESMEKRRMERQNNPQKSMSGMAGRFQQMQKQLEEMQKMQQQQQQQKK